MSTPFPLPPNWTDVLDQIQHALTQAIQLAETREAALTPPAPSPAPAFPLDPRLARMQALASRAAQLENPLQTLDQDLQKEEEHVRSHLQGCADLGRKMADWISTH